MNDELRAAVGTSDCWDWYAQNMSLVVRRTSLAMVLLCRNGEDERLNRPSSLSRLKNAASTHSFASLFAQERLTTADSYASNHLVCHMDSDYTSVFTTRIDALGLMNAGHSELLRQKVANGVTREEYTHKPVSTQTRHLLPDRDPCIRMMDLKEKDLMFVKSALASFPLQGVPASKIIATHITKTESEAAEHPGLTYRDAISFTCDEGIKHVALPAISCGHGRIVLTPYLLYTELAYYRFPPDKEAQIAVESAQRALKSAKAPLS
ncbi:hypothetical protein SELMODRAFT_405956 [Selaginella moellendorffii]|uniref:Uncharacterized protein n=1 Tax=Selaginella moellendorffii TaxID=88036 RepID=D8R073_SELML|nr:hypothetical protein SELMODRAFT_405956 [Selaginella moellendorffii]